MPEHAPEPGHVRVLVIGAGFSGLGLAHSLKSIGIEDFVVLDRGATVGGTWRENTYPGCGVDVASHLYSFSFAPNPAWPRSYSLQPELLRYLEDVAVQHGLLPHVRLRTEVLRADWEDAAARWRVETDAGTWTADVVVAAGGFLTEPKTPAIPGLADFPGPVFHSATWRHDVDLRGKRVAVIGTGASAIQFVPKIQPEVAHLTVFQRTAPWVIPRGDRPISEREHRLFGRRPWLMKLIRAAHYANRESQVGGFVRFPSIMRAPELLSRTQLRAQVSDPVLRRAITPEYRFGCKRVLPTNAWYPAVTAANATLVPHAMASVEGSTVVGADGSRAEVDVIILGTGFDAIDLPIGHRVYDEAGRSLAGVWSEQGRSALRGSTVAGFPNLFLMLGPNSVLGHTSMVYMVESQTRYIVDALKEMTARRLAAISPRPEAQRRYNETLQRRMGHTVWQTGGCSNWYKDEHGRNSTAWPASTLRFRHDTRTVDLREYVLRELDPKVHAARQPQGATTTLVTSDTGVRA